MKPRAVMLVHGERAKMLKFKRCAAARAGSLAWLPDVRSPVTRTAQDALYFEPNSFESSLSVSA
eukprot:6053993-Pleurochrysis_carterae.AAC.3